MVVVENSSYFFGRTMLTDFAGPIIAKYIDQYHLNMVLDSPFPGQGTSSEFSFDYRSVASPYIGNGYVEADILGEWMYRSRVTNKFQDCHMNPLEMEYLPDKEVWSQIVISEAAADCFANAVAKSEIGRLELTEEKLNAAFRMDALKLTTTTLAMHLPLFYEKIGPNKPLKIDVHVKDVKVSFGRYNTDVTLDYTLCVDFREVDPNAVKGGKRLLYDEIKMLSSANIKVENDVMDLFIDSHKINFDRRYGASLKPKDDKMGMSDYEYRKFLSTFGFTMNELKKWLNELVLAGGVAFPYKMDQLDTRFAFREDRLHIFLEFEEKSFLFLEEELIKAQDKKKDQDDKETPKSKDGKDEAEGSVKDKPADEK